MANNKFRFTNEKCPVCNCTFKEDDDIVVCPECGTPHHRECYKENGKCGNHEKHCEGYNWEATFVSPEENDDAEDDVVLSFNQPLSLNQIPGGTVASPLQLNTLKEYPIDFEDGIKTEDVAVSVRQEFPKYFKKFQQIKDGKTTFNWGAFFFAPYWFFYRKLYKLGVIFLTLFILISSLSFLPPAVRFSESAYELETKIQEITETAETDEEYNAAMVNLTNEMTKVLESNRTGIAISLTQSFSALVVSIFIGFKANKWYYKHTVSNIKKVYAENKSEEIKETLFKTGGVAFGATFLAILAEKAIFYALQMLLSAFIL